jgi:hypothetical protein
MDPAQAAAHADLLFYYYLLHLISLIIGKQLAATACRMFRQYHLYSSLSIVLISEIITKMYQKIAVSMKYRIKVGRLARLMERGRMSALPMFFGLCLHWGDLLAR